MTGSRHPVQPARGRGPRARLHARVGRGRPHLLRPGRSPSGPARSCRRRPAPEVLLTTSCTDGARAERDAARPRPGRHGGRAVVHVHQQRPGLRPAGRPDPLLRHRARHPRPRPAPPRRAARRHGPGGRRRPLRRHRLRRRRASARCWPTGPTWRWSRTPPTASSAAGAASRSAASAGSRTLSFHETKNFICGEGGALLLNDHRRRRPGPGPLRQGHRPAGVLPRPGRQVLLARHRLLVRALRHAGRLPAGPARAGASRSRPGAARVFEGYLEALAGPTPTSSGSGCRCVPDDCEPAYHLFHVLLPDAAMRTRGDGDLMREEGIADDLPLRPAARLRRRATVRRPPDRVPGDQRRQRPAAAAAVLQQPHRRRAATGSSTRSCVGAGGGGVVTDARQPAGLVVDRAARLLVVPRPDRPARGRAGRLPRPAARGCSTSAAPTGRAWRGCAATTSGSRSTSTPAGCAPARACCASALALPFRDGSRSTWSAPSTWSSTASRRPWRSPSWPGCWRRAAGCCCRCRPTSGRGPTTTSGPVTTGATRGRGCVAAVEGAGFVVRRCTLRLRRRLPDVRRRAARTPAAAADARRRRCPRSRPRLDSLFGLSRAEAGCSGAATCRSAHRSSWRREALTGPLAGGAAHVLQRPASRRPPPRPPGTSRRCGPGRSTGDSQKAARPGTAPTTQARTSAAVRPRASAPTVSTRLASAKTVPTATSRVSPPGSRTPSPKTSSISGGPSQAPPSRAERRRRPASCSTTPSAEPAAAPRAGPGPTSSVSRPVSCGDQADRQGVRRPEQRQPGEQRGDLGRRAADGRQQHRPAGQHGLAEQLAHRRAGDERQRRLRRRSLRPVGDRSADGQKHDREVAGDQRQRRTPPGSRRRRSSAPAPATQRSPFSTTRPAPSAGNRRRAVSSPADHAHHAGPERRRPPPAAGTRRRRRPNSRSRASHDPSPATSADRDHRRATTPRQRAPDRPPRPRARRPSGRSSAAAGR